MGLSYEELLAIELLLCVRNMDSSRYRSVYMLTACKLWLVFYFRTVDGTAGQL